jgi:Tol biopolymer transport system component
MDGNGNDVQQLTVSEPCHSTYAPDITASGERIVYLSVDAGRLLYGLHYVDADGSGPVTVLTDDRNQAFDHSTITADGETIVFESWLDLTDNGLCYGQENVFRVQADGTGLAQLTFSETCGESRFPVVAANGSQVVFASNGFGSETAIGVYAIPLEGGDVTPIAEDELWLNIFDPRISADGMWATWEVQWGSSVPSPDQVFRGRTDGSVVEMLTDDPDDSSGQPDISGDGQLVVYKSPADPLGTNPDHNSEIFLYDASTRGLHQLTVTSEGDSYAARISDDGEWVYFRSTSPFFGPVIGATSIDRLYRLNVATGLIERTSGVDAWWSFPTVDADGGRAAFESRSAVTGETLQLSRDLWLADFETPATIRPSADAPTVVEWDPDPRALSYDVIRGDVANLAAGPGNTVDLGTVVCLENDTFNTNTAGAEADADQPAPGQVFFFLRRWTQGLGDTLSYGHGSGDAERIPGGGDCPQ